MKSMLCAPVSAAIVLFSGLFCGVCLGQPLSLSSAFTYQGELSSTGTPASGLHDIRFRLFDASTGGTQIGGVLCSDNLDVINGRFATSLDFGAVFAGQRRFLEIQVRQDTGLACADSSGYTTLTPRQELTAAPNATFATSSTTATTAATATNATSLNGQPASFYRNAANLTGTLPSTTIPTNVARLDGNQTFTGLMNFSNPANTFSGSGAGLTNLNGANIAAGTITRSRMAGDVERILSQWTPGSVPLDAVAWGDNANGQTSVLALPAGVMYTAVAAGHLHSLALRSNGTAVAWGNNGSGRTDVPALPAGIMYTAVACGFYHSLAVRSDGSVIAWGDNGSDQLNVPAGLTYTAVAGGGLHSLALRSDGTAVAWGDNSSGQTTVPALPPGVTYSAVAAGTFHSVALRSNGTVIVWGSNSANQLTVPGLPAGVTYTAVASGATHCLALRSNGTLAAWGFNSNGETNVPALPAGMTFTAVAGGGNHSLAIRSDGAIVAWGKNTRGQITVPALPAGARYTAVAGGLFHSIALRGNTALINSNPIVGIGNPAPLIAIDVGLGGVIGTSVTDVSGQHGEGNRGIKASFGSIVSNNSGEFVGMRTVVGPGTAGCGNSGDIRFDTWQCNTANSREVMRINGLGNVNITGSLAKGGGSFKIDHPLDPENKYLYHSFVESPDMMNIYNGNVTTDGGGYATITMPDYFEALNRDFRYQLTVLDDSENDFLLAKVYRKMGVEASRQFTIKTSMPNIEVSWTVTGIRQDAWANKNRIPNSVDKVGSEKGKLLHPAAFGHSESIGIYSQASEPVSAPVTTTPTQPAEN